MASCASPKSSAAAERVQALRGRMQHIRENDNDPDLPRVDADLPLQMARGRRRRTSWASLSACSRKRGTSGR
jgi:hypothetical protein